MIIKLTRSKLFTIDPAIRFADEYRVSPDIFRELWKRYKLLDYSVPELCEVFYIKVGRPIKRRKMDEWLFRGEVYMSTREVVKMGAQAVNSNFFGDKEQRVLNELLRHLKHGESKKPHGIA